MYVVGNWVEGDLGNLSFGDWFSTSASLIVMDITVTYAKIDVQEFTGIRRSFGGEVNSGGGNSVHQKK